MPALNRVQLIGNLGKDPEIRSTSNGKTLTVFSLAVGQRWKNRNGEMQERTEWVNIDAWGRLGEVCGEYLRKGSLIYLEGRLKIDRVEDNGDTKYYTKIVASSMVMLDKKSGEEPVSTVEEEPAEYIV